jgi:hypothetical protein
MDVDFGQSFLLSTAHDGAVEEPFQHFGQNGYDVYSHTLLSSNFLQKYENPFDFQLKITTFVRIIPFNI